MNTQDTQLTLRYFPLLGRVILFWAIATATFGIAVPTAMLMFGAWYLLRVPLGDGTRLWLDKSDEPFYKEWMSAWLILLIPISLVMIGVLAIILDVLSYIMPILVEQHHSFQDIFYHGKFDKWNIGYSIQSLPLDVSFCNHEHCMTEDGSWSLWGTLAETVSNLKEIFRLLLALFIGYFPVAGVAVAAGTTFTAAIVFIFGHNYALLVLARNLVTRLHIEPATASKDAPTNSKFSGTYWSLFGVTAGLFLLSVITLGAIMPYIVYRLRRYVAQVVVIDGKPLEAAPQVWNHIKEWLLIWAILVVISTVNVLGILEFFAHVVAFFYLSRWFMEGLRVAPTANNSTMSQKVLGGSTTRGSAKNSGPSAKASRSSAKTGSATSGSATSGSAKGTARATNASNKAST